MLKTLTIVLGLALAAATGCKTDNAPASPAKSEQTATPGGAKPRSGKIDLPSVPAQPRPELPATADDDEGDGDDGERLSQQAREERLRQRRAALDTDGDGEISEEERAAARAKREQMIKDRLDANKDGVVSDEERANARHQRAVEMHARFDRDGDGKVTPQELQSGPFGRFNLNADANGDGVITVEEIEGSVRDRSQFRRGGRWQRGGEAAGSGSAPSR